MLAASGGFVSMRRSKIIWLIVSIQGSINDGCQNNAIRLRCVVRSNPFTPATCASICGVPSAGGGGRRTSLPEVSAQGFQDPASGNDGVGLLQTPGTAGKDPEKTISDPSRFAQAI